MDVIRLPLRVGAIASVLLLLNGPAPAQTATTTPAKPKPAAAKRTTQPAPRNAKDDYWSVDYTKQTLVGTGRTYSRETTQLTGELGRVPLQSGPGTIGFDTESRVTRNVPGGADPYARKDSSFVGLSINVPSDNKSLAFPILPAPPQ